MWWLLRRARLLVVRSDSGPANLSMPSGFALGTGPDTSGPAPAQPDDSPVAGTVAADIEGDGFSDIFPALLVRRLVPPGDLPPRGDTLPQR